MSQPIQVARVGEVADGGMVKVTINGKDIVVARTGSSYYAVSNKCLHAGGDLSKGTLEGTIITCPRHGTQYDITDGHIVRWLRGSGPVASISKAVQKPGSLATYKVVVQGDNILVDA